MKILHIKKEDTIYVIEKFPLIIVTNIEYRTGWYRYTIDGTKIRPFDFNYYYCSILFPRDCNGTLDKVLLRGNVETRICKKSLELAITFNGKFSD